MSMPVGPPVLPPVAVNCPTLQRSAAQHRPARYCVHRRQSQQYGMRLMSEQGTVQATSSRLSGGLSNQVASVCRSSLTQGMWLCQASSSLCRPRRMGCGT